jgi:hypothetical protein
MNIIKNTSNKFLLMISCIFFLLQILTYKMIIRNLASKTKTSR